MATEKLSFNGKTMVRKRIPGEFRISKAARHQYFSVSGHCKTTDSCPTGLHIN